MSRIKGLDDLALLRPYILALFESWGINIKKCQDCGQADELELHHTRYDSATIYDLELVCRKCHFKRPNSLK